ncbi:MAG: hypothetical protein AMXMBFR64_52630 [Myxococcales bacterium]
MEIVVGEGAPVCESVVGGRCPTLGPAPCDVIVCPPKALGHCEDIAPLAAQAQAECEQAADRGRGDSLGAAGQGDSVGGSTSSS